MFSEFREFVARGNVVDLAVGVIIGAALQRHRQGAGRPGGHGRRSGCCMSGVDFSKLAVVLKPDDPATRPPTKPSRSSTGA
jgi:large conductance mechanosensitive channel